jgi:hypothetical protein
MHMTRRKSHTRAGPGKKVMFIYLVEYWVPLELCNSEVDVYGGLFAVRARDVEDCVEVIFEKYCQYASRTQPETIPALRGQIRNEVMLATKVKLSHRYRESKVLAEYEER